MINWILLNERRWSAVKIITHLGGSEERKRRLVQKLYHAHTYSAALYYIIRYVLLKF